jgi:YegS/Rv2252/BmrU family lipid kinase
MQHIFIVNNAAGRGDVVKRLLPQIRDYFSKHGGDYRIEFTRYKGDATEIARRYALTGEPVRIYSCGGDGTLNEVVNGIVGCENVELGTLPCGSGNDFVASLYADEKKGKEAYLNIGAMVMGGSRRADVLCIDDGLYALNQVSMGFDARVADNFVRFKNKSNVSGSMAYVLSVLYTLMGNITNDISVELDGVPAQKEKLLLAIAGNGKYQGGGMKSVPDADPFNRSLSVMVVTAVGKLRFLTRFPTYMKGGHRRYTDMVRMSECQSVHMTASKPIPVTYDGEILMSQDITVRLVPSAVKIIIPDTVAVKEDKHEVIRRAVAAKK